MTADHPTSGTDAPGPASVEAGPESTAVLLDRARNGQREALDVLLRRVLPPLRRWAHGRLPAGARDLNETADLVQDAVANALRHLDSFDASRAGGLQAYLRSAVLNHVYDEARRVQRRPLAVEIEPDAHPDRAPSPLEQAIGREALGRYERALARLTPVHREAVIARLELQHSYEEIATLLGKPNANAARSVVVRGLYRLYEEMRHEA